MTLRQIIQRELRQLFITDRRRASFLFGASLAYLLLFGLLYAPHVINQIPLVILDEDQTQFSRTLTQAFADSEKFRVVAQATTLDELEHLIDERQAYAAIHIPRDLSREVKAGRSAVVPLLIDGSNIVITNSVSSTAQEIMWNFMKQSGTSLMEGRGLLPQLAESRVSPVSLVFRILHNPTLSYQAFFVIGLAVAALQQGIFLSIGASILGEKNSQDLSGLPASRWLTGKLLPYGIAATIAFGLTISVAVHVLDLPLKGSLTSLLLLAASFIFTAIGFSTTIALLCDTEATLTRLSVIYTVPCFVLSGYTWPLEAMDNVSQLLSTLFPYTFMATTIRELMIAGHSPALAANIGKLLFTGVICYGLASWLYRRQSNTHPTALGRKETYDETF